MYHQLPTAPATQGSVDHENLTQSPDSVSHNGRTSPARLSQHLCLLMCALCTLLNLGLFFVPAFNNAIKPIEQPLARKDITLLRRPSQFIRLDEIKRPSPPEPRQFDNYPILLAQIDRADKTKVFPDDTRQYMSHVGTISPEDRRVLVTETISTIIQFRAIDWGMEICELRLSLPALFFTNSTAPVPDARPRLLSSQSFPFSIYRVNATLPLDISTISHETRPPRVAKVGDVHFGSGIDSPTFWHRKFTCAEEEILSFELAFSEANISAMEGEACRIEWWQNKDHPDPAIYITQYATK